MASISFNKNPVGLVGIKSLSFSPTSQLLAVGGWDGEVTSHRAHS